MRTCILAVTSAAFLNWLKSSVRPSTYSPVIFFFVASSRICRAVSRFAFSPHSGLRSFFRTRPSNRSIGPTVGNRVGT